MKKIFLFLLLVSAVPLFSAQGEKFWVYFRDKDASVRSLLKTNDAVSVALSCGISERAMIRRAKVLTADKLLTDEDLPVSERFIRLLTAQGIVIENCSRWLNAVTAYLTPGQLALVQKFSFVQKIEPVRIFKRKNLSRIESSLEKYSSPTMDTLHSYGPSYDQLAQIHVIDVHNLRITGRGVLVGMLDTGFRWRTHEAMKYMDVIKEYDFIQKDTVTENEGGKAPIDYSNQDAHGTLTMSVVGGYKEGVLVSPAYGASFILGKTEYVPTETNVEEDNWVAGIEWEEAYGVDVVSSSLAYNEFDAGQKNYTYQDMNGRTATTTKSAVLAMRRGVVVVNAMGNEALASWHYLTAPADADSIISVGAVTNKGTIAGFSSVGPTSDGRIKPDVVAQGVATFGASTGPYSTYGYYEYAQGTSLSTPLVAGSAALVLSAHPELTPVQVRDALRNTASNASAPNNSIGWGIIDAYKAVLYNGMVISTDPEIFLTQDSNYSVSMFIISSSVINQDSVRLYYRINKTNYLAIPMSLVSATDAATNSGKYRAMIPKPQTGEKIYFYISAHDGSGITRKSPYGAPNSFFDLQSGMMYVPRTTPPSGYTVEQNYPNPFNPNTRIRFSVNGYEFVQLKVFDLLGREVSTLIEQIMIPGVHTVEWNAADHPSGIYFYRLQTKSFTDTKKMILIR